MTRDRCPSDLAASDAGVSAAHRRRRGPRGPRCGGNGAGHDARHALRLRLRRASTASAVEAARIAAHNAGIALWHRARRQRSARTSTAQPARFSTSSLAIAVLIAERRRRRGRARRLRRSRVLTALAPHAPIEFAALSLAGGAYVHARSLRHAGVDARGDRRRRALALLAIAAALLETYVSSGSDPMTPSRRTRLLAIPLVWLPASSALVGVRLRHATSSHTWRQLADGPPRHAGRHAPSTGPSPPRLHDDGAPARSRSSHLARSPRSASACLAALHPHRRRTGMRHAAARGRSTAGSCASAATTSPTPTASKRPSRASPARSASRWYERLWRGPRAPRARGPPPPRRVDPLRRRRAPLPRAARSADHSRTSTPTSSCSEVDGEPDWAHTRRPPEETRLVRAVDPDDPQLRARVLRVARRAALAHDEARLSVQLVLDAGARLRAPPRAAAAQAPRARAAARRPPRPRRARHRLRRRGQGAQGRARTAAPLAAASFDLRVVGDDRDVGAARRRPVRPAAIRERTRAPRDAPAAARCTHRRIAAAIPNPLPGWRTGVLSTSELATLWQLPRGRVKHARLLRATVRRAMRAARDRPRSPRACCCTTSAARSRIAPDGPQVRPRAHRWPGRRQELGDGPPLRQRRARRRPRRHPASTPRDRSPSCASGSHRPIGRCTTSTSGTPRSASTR